jgi:DNA mismatch repair ATPase MutL
VGIPVADRALLGRRSATSKLSEIEDLERVETYGFRGEALASLCVIGLVTVTTCIAGEATAKQLEFDHQGNILSYRCWTANLFADLVGNEM